MKKLLIIFLLFSYHAQSVIFEVDTTNDTNDILPGNGICLDASGNCSLRAAIQETNQLATADTIYLQRSTTYNLTLITGSANDEQLGDLDITDSLTLSIIDPSTPAASLNELPIISANGIDRVLDISNAETVTLFALIITQGDGNLIGLSQSGGGIQVHPDVINFNLLNSVIFGNSANKGAGISTSAVNSLISFSDISFNVLNSSVISSPAGVGILNQAGTLTIQYSSIHDNNIDNSIKTCAEAINNNAATMLIFSTTIAFNGSNSGCTSGIHGNEGEIFLVNTTIKNNSEFGIKFDESIGVNSLFVRNSIIADNEIIDCGGAQTGLINFGDLNGSNNITSDNSCNMPIINTHNFENTDPKLDQANFLFANSPFFIFYEPLPTSPAIDNGSPLTVNVGNPHACQQFDQILRTRPIDSDGNGSAICDIGAVENNYDLIFKNSFGEGSIVF